MTALNPGSERSYPNSGIEIQNSEGSYSIVVLSGLLSFRYCLYKSLYLLHSLQKIVRLYAAWVYSVRRSFTAFALTTAVEERRRTFQAAPHFLALFLFLFLKVLIL